VSRPPWLRFGNCLGWNRRGPNCLRCGGRLSTRWNDSSCAPSEAPKNKCVVSRLRGRQRRTRATPPRASSCAKKLNTVFTPPPPWYRAVATGRWRTSGVRASRRTLNPLAAHASRARTSAKLAKARLRPVCGTAQLVTLAERRIRHISKVLRYRITRRPPAVGILRADWHGETHGVSPAAASVSTQGIRSAWEGGVVSTTVPAKMPKVCASAPPAAWRAY